VVVAWQTLLFPLRGREAAMLKEGVGDHCHKGVTVKSMPGPSFEVIERKLFLDLSCCSACSQMRRALMVLASTLIGVWAGRLERWHLL
jgi:hypothetical protein